MVLLIYLNEHFQKKLEHLKIIYHILLLRTAWRMVWTASQAVRESGGGEGDPGYRRNFV